MVKLIECPRDAWQGLKRYVPAQLKVRYLRALIDAGFKHLDAVSFVSPKAVPQMADSEQVLEELAPPRRVEIIGIVVNERGAERAIATGAVNTVGFPSSISETFLQRNQNQSLEENRSMLERVAHLAHGAGLNVVAYISMAFGNPYQNEWNEDLLANSIAEIAGVGVDAISLADTVGVAGPELIQRVVARAVPECDPIELGVHLHSTRANAAGKIRAAFDAGCRRFDSALGGLGGCPFAQDELVGNIPTEEVIRAMQMCGVDVEGNLAPLTMSDAIAAQFSA
ncbi:MAG: hydroxymethylglutaryl-CoA lyase [Chthoniobacterales bacterium]|jgi:hydroxymethylglutaryl-CoA lyase